MSSRYFEEQRAQPSIPLRLVLLFSLWPLRMFVVQRGNVSESGQLQNTVCRLPWPLTFKKEAPHPGQLISASTEVRNPHRKSTPLKQRRKGSLSIPDTGLRNLHDFLGQTALSILTAPSFPHVDEALPWTTPCVARGHPDPGFREPPFA